MAHNKEKLAQLHRFNIANAKVNSEVAGRSLIARLSFIELLKASRSIPVRAPTIAGVPDGWLLFPGSARPYPFYGHSKNDGEVFSSVNRFTPSTFSDEESKAQKFSKQ